jgi:hypothetical protein
VEGDEAVRIEPEIPLSLRRLPEAARPFRKVDAFRVTATASWASFSTTLERISMSIGKSTGPAKPGLQRPASAERTPNEVDFLAAAMDHVADQFSTKMGDLANLGQRGASKKKPFASRKQQPSEPATTKPQPMPELSGRPYPTGGTRTKFDPRPAQPAASGAETSADRVPPRRASPYASGGVGTLFDPRPDASPSRPETPQAGDPPGAGPAPGTERTPPTAAK